MNRKTIVSKALGAKVVLSSDSIDKATGCLDEGSTYHEGWENNYDSNVARALYKENIENTGDQETIVYNLMFERENILNKSILHKVWSKTTLSDLHKFMLFHLIENFPFNLPHTFYINIQKNLKGLGGPDDIYYAALINKMLWD